MNNQHLEVITQKAIEELEAKSLGVTEQFLEAHKIAYIGDKPNIARIDCDNKDEAIVYFHVENERFYFSIYVDLKPNISVRWADTTPYHSVRFRVISETLSVTTMSKLTKLTPSKSANKGDRKKPNNENIIWKESRIEFEPNPEADEFEAKLTKLLDYLEQDKAGVEELVNKAECHIQVWSCFHNGNTMLGGYQINKDIIKRMGALNISIDFDIYAEGNFIK